MRSHGPWTIRSEREVYADPWIHVRRDEVIRPDGADGTHALVTVKAGVSVLAIDEQQQVYLTDEFHYAVGRQTLEVVSGGIEPGEEPEICGQRELREELGIQAKRWTPLGMIDPFTSIVLSPVWLYLAQDLEFVDRQLDGTEIIDPVVMSLEEAVAAVFSGRITHSPSCVMLLKARLMLDGYQLPAMT
jgi:ADP-ribose pyrophosphatase